MTLSLIWASLLGVLAELLQDPPISNAEQEQSTKEVQR